MKNIFQKTTQFFGKINLRTFRFKEKSSIAMHSYKEYIPVIEKCYGLATYWHGTGRYHYHYSGNSKYEGVDDKTLLDVLDSIIESNGLIPRFDPWIKVSGHTQESISVTPFRMYARVYAGFHQYEKNQFQYEYGTPKYWFYFLGILQLLEQKPVRNIKNALKMKYTKSFVKYSQTWMHTLRSDLNEKPLNPSKLYLLRSDIQDNYAILIGIKKEAVVPIHFDSIIERFETRTEKIIPLNDITHIEVPLRNVKETEEFLKTKNISLLVIPLEFGEIYCNKYSLKELSGAV